MEQNAEAAMFAVLSIVARGPGHAPSLAPGPCARHAAYGARQPQARQTVPL